jgi:hypothetical protein
MVKVSKITREKLEAIKLLLENIYYQSELNFAYSEKQRIQVRFRRDGIAFHFINGRIKSLLIIDYKELNDLTVEKLEKYIQFYFSI